MVRKQQSMREAMIKQPQSVLTRAIAPAQRRQCVLGCGTELSVPRAESESRSHHADSDEVRLGQLLSGVLCRVHLRSTCSAKSVRSASIEPLLLDARESDVEGMPSPVSIWRDSHAQPMPTGWRTSRLFPDAASLVYNGQSITQHDTGTKTLVPRISRAR